MSKEIDIIELLKRVEEGKAPKEIAINGDKYNYFEDWITPDEIYFTKAHGEDENLCYWEMDFDTKIKILDEPIIEELDEIELKSFNDEAYIKLVIRNNRDKINEIIKHINKEEK